MIRTLRAPAPLVGVSVGGNRQQIHGSERNRSVSASRLEGEQRVFYQ
jgi:hypothetical protein